MTRRDKIRDELLRAVPAVPQWSHYPRMIPAAFERKDKYTKECQVVRNGDSRKQKRYLVQALANHLTRDDNLHGRLRWMVSYLVMIAHAENWSSKATYDWQLVFPRTRQRTDATQKEIHLSNKALLTIITLRESTRPLTSSSVPPQTPILTQRQPRNAPC